MKPSDYNKPTYDFGGNRLDLPLHEFPIPKNHFQDMEIVLNGELHFVAHDGDCMRCMHGHDCRLAEPAGTFTKDEEERMAVRNPRPFRKTIGCHGDVEAIVDAVRTKPMTFRDLQTENAEWVARNFPNKAPYHPLLGVVEEIGELAHAFLKAEQGIRVGEDHQTAKVDAVADCIIFLADFCTKAGIDMQDAVEQTWAEVRKRDWIKFPRNGLSE